MLIIETLYVINLFFQIKIASYTSFLFPIIFLMINFAKIRKDETRKVF